MLGQRSEGEIDGAENQSTERTSSGDDQRKHGRHADGGGLYLSISPNGGRRWVFLYRWHGKPTEIGFGSARDVHASPRP